MVTIKSNKVTIKSNKGTDNSFKVTFNNLTLGKLFFLDRLLRTEAEAGNPMACDLTIQFDRMMKENNLKK